MAYSRSTNFSASTLGPGATNYTGEVLEDLLTYTAQENETYKQGLIHIKSGIQKKYTLPGISLGQIIQDRKATPVSPTDSLGTYKFSERYLEPQDFMVYIEFDPRDMEQYYKPFQPTGNLVFRELDPKVQATMIRLLMERKAEYINHAIWCAATATEKAKVASAVNGVTSIIGDNDDAGPMKYFNGAIARLLANKAATAGSAEANTGQCIVTGNSALATGEAVANELYAMWHACPAKIRNKVGLTFLMDYESWDKYDQYCSTQLYKYTDNSAENQRRFRGKRVIPMVALPANTIILSVFTTGMDSNLWMGVDYANDENVLQVERLQANSELYFFKMLLKMDVNIVKPGEIVAHLPFTYTA